MQHKKNPFKVLLSYFFRGMLLTIPLALTVYLIFYVFNTLDHLIPFDQPGLGVLALLLFITLMGVLGSTFIADPIKRYFNQILERAPLIKTIYSSIKDLLSAFVGDKKGFSQPVLVQLGSEPGLEKLGFITAEDLSALNLGEDKIAVYLPFSYAFTGNLFITDKKRITPLDANSSEVMKFIVSGGVADVPKLKDE